MRLIDATKAIESIDEIVCSMSVCINSDYFNGMRAMKDMALHAIDEQPTVDAVQVVRCGECKYFVQKQDNIGECSALLSGKFTGRYWFCADGEKREE